MDPDNRDPSLRRGPPSEDLSLLSVRHLSYEKTCELIAARISSHNSTREGKDPEILELRFGSVFDPRCDAPGDDDDRLPIPVLANPADGDIHSQEFVDHLLISPVSKSMLADAYRQFPSYTGAFIVSWFLMYGGRADRDMVLDLFSEFAKLKDGPSTPITHQWMISAIAAMLAGAPDGEREQWIKGLTDLLRQASETFFKGWQFFLSDCTHNADLDYKRASGLIDALLGSKLPHAYCAVLACAVSPTIDSNVKTYALTRLVEAPCPGTPALNQFLRGCLQESDLGERSKRLRILGSAGGFLSEYWGPLALWALERPLRLANARGESLTKVYGDTCQKMSPATFPFAYSFADGKRDVLASLDRSLSAHDLNEAEVAWMSRQLRHSLIRASFLSPFQQLQCHESVVQIDTTSEIGRRSLLNALGNASLRQREDLPHIVVRRLIELSGADLEGQHSLLSSLPPKSSVVPSSPQARSYMSVDPTWTAQDQVTAVGTSCPGIQSWLEDMSWHQTYVDLGEDVHKRWFCGSPSSPLGSTNPSSLHQFVRAQTIHNVGASELLGVLSEAFGQPFSTGDFQRWVEWRYNLKDPAVARQLRSLSPGAREIWATEGACGVLHDRPVGGAIAVRELQGKAKYLVLEVDDPLWLFNLGVIPRLSVACTAFNAGSYYSKNTVSNVVDAHIKGLIVFDATRITKELLPRMPPTYQKEYEEGRITRAALRAGFYHLSTAVVHRSMCKLVEDNYGNPILLMEPTFINGSLGKRGPTPDLLRFALFLARKYGAGLSVSPYIDDGRLPMRGVVMPPSRSPGGQIENHDYMPWMASYHGATVVNARELIPPPLRGADHPFWQEMFS